MQYGFIIDNRKCIGCHACTVACKAEHEVPIGVNRTWVKYIEKGEFPNTRRLFTVTRCNHCSDAPCVEICPVTSLYIRKDGIVDFDPQRCIGCKACMQACPYDALFIDPASHTSSKCNYCAHRTERGLEPACVIVCPVQAIVSGDLENPASRIAQLLAKEPTTIRKPEKHTKPNLFYIDADPTALVPTQAVPHGTYASTEQVSGVGHFAHLTERLAERTGGGAPENLAKLLAIAEKEADTRNAWKPKGAARAVRTYDAPQRGVLWDWEVVAYTWTKSISAGVLFVPLLLNVLGLLPLRLRLERGMAFASLLFLALTGALLVKDLDQPRRFLSVVLRPQWRSWLVRGAYILGAFGTFGAAWALHLYFGEGQVIGLRILLVLLGGMTAIYTAFLFAQAKGRDLWQSPLLPFSMLTTSVMTGSALVLLMALLGGLGVELPLVATLAGAIIAHLALLVVEFAMPHATPDTRNALASMVRGSLRIPFWSALALGNLLPLVLLAIAPEQGMAVFPACVLVLTFALVSEHVWVRAPQLIPLR